MEPPAKGATTKSEALSSISRSSTSESSSFADVLDDSIKQALPFLVALAIDRLFTLEADKHCCRLYLEDLMKQLLLDENTHKAVHNFVKHVGSNSSSSDFSDDIEPMILVIRSKLWNSCSELGDKRGGLDTIIAENVAKTAVVEASESRTSQDTGKGSTDLSEPMTVSISEDSNRELAITSHSSEEVSSISETSSPLTDTLNEDLAVTIISCLIAPGLLRGRYDSRVRICIRYVVHKLRLKWDLVEDVEDSLVVHFSEANIIQTEAEKKQMSKSRRLNKIKRIATISVATVLGGVAIGLSGGLLAAPAIAAAVGGVAAAGGIGAFIGSAAGAAVVGSLFGAVGGGLTGYKMKRRVGAVEEFEFVPLSDGQQLHLAIALPGWLSSKQPDCRNAYYTLSIAREQYCLKFESKYLLELGNALDYFLNIATSSATANVASEIATQSAVGTIWLATAWPQFLLSFANVIDNPWSVCLRRSAKAGEHLAEVLLMRQQGHRPVTLIGYSLGARAIFYCLMEMSRDKHAAYNAGIIQNVILLGAPVTADPADWGSFSRVVAGEIINGYSRTDWLLKFLYRSTNAKTRIAGLGPVEWNDRRMFNMDLSHIIMGHGDYLHKIDIVLSELGIGERRKATLMPLSAARRQLSTQSISSYASSSTKSDAVKRSTSINFAIEQLQLAEKLRSEGKLEDTELPPSDPESAESAAEAESLNESEKVVSAVETCPLGVPKDDSCSEAIDSIAKCDDGKKKEGSG